MDELISEMLAAGLDSQDLMQLEKLSNPLILQSLPETERGLRHNRRDDVVVYLNRWAQLLEEQWLQKKASLVPVPAREKKYAYPFPAVTSS